MNIKDSYLHGTDEKGVIKNISLYKDKDSNKTKGITFTRAQTTADGPLEPENLEFGELTTTSASANKLTTARKLGVNFASTADATFDGTADQTNIPVSGTLPATNGGTGLNTIRAGSILYGSGSNAIAELVKNDTTTKKYLQSANGNPSWQLIAYSDISETPTIPTLFSITATDDILDGVGGNNSVLYKPYATQLDKLSFDTSTTAPSRTDRLNLNGDFYATNLNSTDAVNIGTSGSASTNGKGKVVIKQRGKASKATTLQASDSTTADYTITLPAVTNTAVVAGTPALNNILAANSTTPGDGKWISLSDIVAGNLAKEKGVLYLSNTNVTNVTKPTSGTAYLTGTDDGTVSWATPVTSFGTKTGAITLEAGTNAAGHIKLEMSDNELKGTIEGWKAYTETAPSSASNNTTIPTSQAVYEAINNGIATTDAMIYKGVIAGAATAEGNAYGALTPAADKGHTYKVSVEGYINGVKVEAGDMLICNADSTAKATSANYTTIVSKWDFIQANLDPNIYLQKSAGLVGASILVGATTSATSAVTSATSNPSIVGTLTIENATSNIGGVLIIGGTNVTTSGEAGKITINGLATLNLKVNGIDYAIATSESSLPTITVNNATHTIAIGSSGSNLALKTTFSANASENVTTYIPLATTNVWGAVKGNTDGETGTGDWKKCKIFAGEVYYYNTNTTYTVNDGKLTLTVGGAAVTDNDKFTANASGDTTYNVPIGSTDTYGVYKVTGSTTATVSEVGSTADRYYGVGKDSDNKLYTNIPWTDTKLTTAATTSKMYLVGKIDANKAIASTGVYDAAVSVTNGALASTSLTTTAGIVAGTTLKATTTLEVVTTSALKGDVTLGTSTTAADLIYLKGSYTGTLKPTTLTANTTWTLPATTGFLVTSGSTTAAVGSSSIPVYISSAGVATACSLGAAANYGVKTAAAAFTPQTGTGAQGLVTEEALAHALSGVDAYKAESYDNLLINLKSSEWSVNGKDSKNQAHSISISGKESGTYAIQILDTTMSTIFSGTFSIWKLTTGTASNNLDEIPLHMNSAAAATSRIYAATKAGKIYFSCNNDTDTAHEHNLKVTIKRVI